MRRVRRWRHSRLKASSTNCATGSASTRSTCASRMPPRRAQRRASGPPGTGSGWWRHWRRRRSIRISPHRLLKAPVAAFSCGFWFNHAGETAVQLALSEDGTVQLSVGTPDIGGSRRIHVHDGCRRNSAFRTRTCAPTVADTATLGYNEISHGLARDLCERSGHDRGGT